MTHTLATYLALAGTGVGILGLSWFVLAYARVRFERSHLGIVLMSVAASTLFLAVTAVVRRVGPLLGWTWTDSDAALLAVAAGWVLLGLAYAWLTRYLLRVQRQETRR